MTRNIRAACFWLWGLGGCNALDADGVDDLDLFARPLAGKLRGEHAKGFAVALGMPEDGPGAVEPSPLVVAVDDANKIIDGTSPIGNERQ